MSGSTISTVSYASVTLGSGGYSSSLSITNAGTIIAAGETGQSAISAGRQTDFLIVNQGGVFGGQAVAGINGLDGDPNFNPSGYGGSAGGYGSNAITAFVYGTIDNSGSIAGKIGGTGGQGGDSATTTDGGFGGFVSGGMGGSGGSGGNGVFLEGGGTITNTTGLITGGNGGDGGNGGYGGPGGGYGPFGNHNGTGGAGGKGGAGLAVSGKGYVTNNGTITGGVGGSGGNGGNGGLAPPGYPDPTSGMNGTGGAGGVGLFLDALSGTNAGLIAGGQGGYGVAGGGGGDGVQLVEATLDNFGTISAGAGGKSSGLGVATGAQGDAVRFLLTGTLIAEASAVFNGAIEGRSGYNDALVLAGSTSTEFIGFNSQITNINNVQFAANAARDVEIDGSNVSSAIHFYGFASGDTFVINNFTETSANFDSDGLVLNSASVLGSEFITLGIVGDFGTADFTFAQSGGNTTIALSSPLLCFYSGTRVATPQGAQTVETLSAGDLVRTVKGVMPVRWIGQSQVSTRFADPLRVLPIRICEGALGGGLPERDLLLSPDHAVFIDGILVHAGALVNGRSIFREANVPEVFTYYHIELASHELLFVEGALAESFVDNADRMNFSNWESREIEPEAIVEMSYPRAKSFRQVPPKIRQALDMNKAA